jgi:hypothetical protein
MTPTDPHVRDSSLHNEDVAHEHSDVNIRALLMFCFGLMAVTAVVMVAMWALFQVFEGQAAANDPVMSPHARPAGQLPPEPRLLTDEPRNLQRFRAQEADVLKGIDEAKKRLLEAGLPVRADAPTDQWIGTRSPARGESSSGRAIPVKPGSDPAQPAPPKSGGH